MESVVETRQGRVAGVERRGLHLFRGIRYARPPVGEAKACFSSVGTRFALAIAHSRRNTSPQGRSCHLSF